MAQNAGGPNGGLGGAIEINSAGTTVIVNSTFANNTAVPNATPASFGGAINSFSLTNTLKISFSSFWGNSAHTGADISSNPMPTVNASIFENALMGGNCTNHVTDVGGFSISDDASCNTGHDGSSKQLVMTGLSNNGGPTDTIALQGWRSGAQSDSSGDVY